MRWSWSLRFCEGRETSESALEVAGAECGLADLGPSLLQCTTLEVPSSTHLHPEQRKRLNPPQTFLNFVCLAPLRPLGKLGTTRTLQTRHIKVYLWTAIPVHRCSREQTKDHAKVGRAKVGRARMGWTACSSVGGSGLQSCSRLFFWSFPFSSGQEAARRPNMFFEVLYHCPFVFILTWVPLCTGKHARSLSTSTLRFGKCLFFWLMWILRRLVSSSQRRARGQQGDCF